MDPMGKQAFKIPERLCPGAVVAEMLLMRWWTAGKA
jgi:hypothetical protein